MVSGQGGRSNGMGEKEMKKKIFLEAARRIAEYEDTYSCTAVSRTDGYRDGNLEASTARRWYSLAFSPRQDGEKLELERELRTGDINSISLRHNKQRDFRVLLLCFAAVVEVPYDDS